MNAIKTAISLLPLLGVLYNADVIDIMPGSTPYIQITPDLFRELFPDIGPKERKDDSKEFTFYVDGVKILAVEV